jgi:hypothetical protein
MPETDAQWALRQAKEITADSDYYDRLIQRYGRKPVWVSARDDALDTAYRLVRLAAKADQ